MSFLDEKTIDLSDETVHVQQVSWDILFYDDIMNHNGFEVKYGDKMLAPYASIIEPV